ncbi:MAG: aspartyl/asparaginyl beta-hydroxylase domain-containing protein, partial [Sandarakinorhabdus sp.]|nr:aspartyl/asparaginyl beta-hydroxylase domain-containing protein [Sandarakinorhabdus sp.]
AALAPLLGQDPENPYGLLMHGDLHNRDGDDRAAASWYDRAFDAASRLEKLPADLIERLQRAEAQRAAIAARFTAAMAAALDAAGIDASAAGERFTESLAIVVGTAQPALQQPTSFYFPGLPQRAFYDPADFAWAAGLEAAYPAIRAEAAEVLADRSGTAPYVEAPKDRPMKPHSLLGDPRWSAFHLMQNGAPVAANAARCPATMAALKGLLNPGSDGGSIPVIAGRSPMVLFSILAPGTHIEPHNGMLNTRLICHLPLIVPPDCRLRVGNSLRTVEAGKLLIFDDSIQHEAWNDSAEMRIILLFEIWRPELTAAERAGLTSIFEAISVYGSD